MKNPPANAPAVFNRRAFFKKMALGLSLVLCPDLKGAGRRPDSPAPPASDETGEALPEELRRWQSRPRIPVSNPHGGHDALFLEAIRRKETLRGRHHGKTRRITPLMLFAVGELDDDDPDDDRYAAIYDDGDPVGPYYLQVWDHDYAAERTYKAESFVPLPTAPWMRPHFNCRTDAEWAHTHTQCMDWLHEEDTLQIPRPK